MFYVSNNDFNNRIYFRSIAGACFVNGDGIGGNEKKLGEVSTKEACIAKVKSEEPTANGATYGRGKCWAEFGMTGANSNANFQTCKFKAEGDYSYSSSIKDIINQLNLVHNDGDSNR